MSRPTHLKHSQLYWFDMIWCAFIMERLLQVSGIMEDEVILIWKVSQTNKTHPKQGISTIYRFFKQTVAMVTVTMETNKIVLQSKGLTLYSDFMNKTTYQNIR